MILGFKKQFKEKILSGSKIHTIREDKNERWNIGRIIHFATGVRTKNYEQFYEDTCKSVQDIEIWYKNKDSDYPIIIIDGRMLRVCEKKDWEILRELAANDGFESFEGFCAWFNKDFKGKIIHWTGLKY